MTDAFDHFTSFFHQDALLDEDDMRSVAEKAVASMSVHELIDLKSAINAILLLNDDEAITKWNNSKSDIIIRGGKIKMFLTMIRNLVDNRLKCL
jgi:hypothetical protein